MTEITHRVPSNDKALRNYCLAGATVLAAQAAVASRPLLCTFNPKMLLQTPGACSGLGRSGFAHCKPGLQDPNVGTRCLQLDP